MRGRELVRWIGTALALSAAVLALYWPVRTHDFVSYDDEVYLTTNPHVAKGLDWAEIRWVFTHSHAANYHPLTWVSHMLDVELFGLEPGPHHLVNVALHAVNAVLVLFLARALLGGLCTPLLTAALFALHPLRVESVAWASERKDVLCATFFLGGLLAYLGYGRAPSLGRYLVVCALSALALLAKPMAVTFPCVALLLDVWPLGRLDPARPWRARVAGTGRRIVLEKLPLLALAAGGAVSTWFAQELGGAVTEMQVVGLELRVWNAVVAYGAYLRETVWPAGLAVFHPLAAVVEPNPRAALLVPALLSAAVLGGIGVLAWRLRARHPWLLVGWCWFLGMLVPAIGLKQVGSQAHADRYTYLPLIGVAWIGAELLRRAVARRPALRPAACALALGAVAALTLAARAQVRTWRDTPTLFQHALDVTEKNYVAHGALGAYWIDKDPELARFHLERAPRLYPLYATALLSLGRLELGAGNLEAAEEQLMAARRIHDSKWVRYHVGLLRLRQGRPEEAARELESALEIDPSMVDARFNLGQVLYGLGRRAEARAHFERALELDPDHAGAHNGLGVVLLETDPVAAETRFRRAVELDPAYADAVNNLGVALERQGRHDEARARYAEARTLKSARQRPQ